MQKAAVKIIKRYKQAVTEKTDQPTVSDGDAKAENNTERGMVDTIAGWISERRANKRAEEVDSMSRISQWKNDSEILSHS